MDVLKYLLLVVKNDLIKDKQNLLYHKEAVLFLFLPWNALLIVACKFPVSPQIFPYFTNANVKVLNAYLPMLHHTCFWLRSIFC